MKKGKKLGGKAVLNYLRFKKFMQNYLVANFSMGMIFFTIILMTNCASNQKSSLKNGFANIYTVEYSQMPELGSQLSLENLSGPQKIILPSGAEGYVWTASGSQFNWSVSDPFLYIDDRLAKLDRFAIFERVDGLIYEYQYLQQYKALVGITSYTDDFRFYFNRWDISSNVPLSNMPEIRGQNLLDNFGSFRITNHGGISNNRAKEIFSIDRPKFIQVTLDGENFIAVRSARSESYESSSITFVPKRLDGNPGAQSDWIQNNDHITVSGANTDYLGFHVTTVQEGEHYYFQTNFSGRDPLRYDPRFPSGRGIPDPSDPPQVVKNMAVEFNSKKLIIHQPVRDVNDLGRKRFCL